MTSIPTRPNPAILGSPELEEWCKAALPKTLAITMSGRIWALNHYGKPVLVKPPGTNRWEPPETDPIMAAVGPTDVMATAQLWDEKRPPWAVDFTILHGLEALVWFLKRTGAKRAGRPFRGNRLGPVPKSFVDGVVSRAA